MLDENVLDMLREHDLYKQRDVPSGEKDEGVEVLYSDYGVKIVKLSKYSLGKGSENLVAFVNREKKDFVFVNGDSPHIGDSDFFYRVIDHEKLHLADWSRSEKVVRYQTGTDFPHYMTN